MSQAMVETLWPTRCALCDEPGVPLCDACRRALPYIDWWQACPRCGSPYGRTQCCECNPIVLASLNRQCLPYAQARSAMTLSPQARRIVTVYKDQGERSLAAVMGDMVAALAPPEWIAGAVTFVPASKAAVRKRGFDHAELLAQEVARRLDLPCVSLLQRPRSKDQRILTRKERLGNMDRAMAALPGATIPSHVIAVDDVYTTGATLMAASDALLKAGGSTVRCLTFARAW